MSTTLSRLLLLAFGFALLTTACSEAVAPTVGDNEQVQNRGEGKDAWWETLPRAAWSNYPRVDLEASWFEVYEVAPRVFGIYEPGQFEEVISYLIEGSERALLFDSGLGIGDMKSIVSQLTDHEVWVLNSHTHYDHVGGNHQFQNIYGTRTDYTAANALGRSHEKVAEFVGEGWIWKPTPDGFSRDTYHSKPFSISESVEDGQTIDLGGVRVEVLLTPGHAPDSLCLLDRERGLLFTGDTFYPATLYAHLEGSRFEEYYETAQRLSGLSESVNHVLPAHNEPYMASQSLIDLGEAFDNIQKPDTEYVLTDGNREYSFESFSILVSDPPPWEK